MLYLAIAPGRRGGGVGRRLVTTALDDWRALDPLVVVGEVEHPAHHTGSEAHGDPVARLRFYARLGARILALPYFQPGDGPGGERVPALLLVSFPLGPHAAEDDVPAAPLRAFLAENLRESEGTLADDAATRRLLDAAGGDRVRVVDPDDPAALATVPVGTLTPAEIRPRRPDPPVLADAPTDQAVPAGRAGGSGCVNQPGRARTTWSTGYASSGSSGPTKNTAVSP